VSGAPAAGLSADQVEALRAAVRLLPWHAVTHEEIAQAVGVSRMTLHRRGIGKPEALTALREALVSEHHAAATAALATTGPAGDRLRDALVASCTIDERYLKLIDSVAEDFGAVFHEEGDGPVLTRAGFTDALRAILQDGIADGTLRSDDPVEDATLLFNAAGWTYRHLRSGHRWTPQHASDRVVALLLDGVTAAARAATPPSPR
jgi:AcrR family transcriptional regulator